MRKKSKVGEELKVPTPNKDEIICPAVLAVTKGSVAYNYGVEWAGQTKLTLNDGTEVVGVWRSAVRTGPHKGEFEKFLAQMFERNITDWKDKSWYFTHEEGKEAVQKYINNALSGEVKVNKKVWKRFEETAGVSYEELVANHPHTYTKGALAPMSSTHKLNDLIEADPLDTLDGPKDEELLSIADSAEHGLLRNIDDGDIKQLVFDRSQVQNQRVSEERIIVYKKGNDRELYKVYLEHMDLVMYLEPGGYDINGIYVSVEVTDNANEETTQAHGGS